LSVAALMYTQDFRNYNPSAADWPETLRPYYMDDSVLASPHKPEAGRAYAMSAALDLMRYDDVKEPGSTVFFFEAEFGSPPSGGPELLPDEPRHPDGYVISFYDGHVTQVPPEEIDELIWQLSETE